MGVKYSAVWTLGRCRWQTSRLRCPCHLSKHRRHHACHMPHDRAQDLITANIAVSAVVAASTTVTSIVISAGPATSTAVGAPRGLDHMVVVQIEAQTPL